MEYIIICVMKRLKSNKDEKIHYFMCKCHWIDFLHNFVTHKCLVVHNIFILTQILHIQKGNF